MNRDASCVRSSRGRVRSRELEMELSQKFRILVIDDEPINCHIFRNCLKDTYEVMIANDGTSGLSLASTELPDLILLDLNMPEPDGFQVCQILRDTSLTREIPIIIVTGSDHTDARVRAYGLGADDLLAKPFSGSELLARVQSKVRRIKEKTPSKDFLTCGNLTIDLKKHEVHVNDQHIDLSVIEFNLLKFFVENHDRIVHRKEILSKVWENCNVSRRTIDTHVLSLRKNLLEFNHEISAVYGIGYGLKEK